jgi:hypothetical protein
MGARQKRRQEQHSRMPIPEKVHAQTRPAKVSGGMGFPELQKLLGMGEPKSPEEKKQRFEKLMKAYSDPNLAAKFMDCLSLMNNRKKRLDYLLSSLSSASVPKTGQDKRRIKTKWDMWRKIASEHPSLEENLLLYKKLVSQLESYAPDKHSDMGKVKRVAHELWQDAHGQLMNVYPSSEFLRAELCGIGLSNKEADIVFRNVQESMKQFDLGQFIVVGSGPAAQEKALQIKEVLEGYPQFVLSPRTVSITERKDGEGKSLWIVQIRSSKLCEPEKAVGGTGR